MTRRYFGEGVSGINPLQPRLAFTIIELLVTISIMGLLMATIIPSLGRSGRANSVNLSAQSVREALAQLHAYSISPDPAICSPMQNGYSGTLPVTRFSIFIPGGTATPTPWYDVETNVDGQWPETSTLLTDRDGYKCGVAPKSISLQNNQFALLAEQVDATGHYVLGIIAIGTLDAPTRFVSPFPAPNNAEKPVWFGYNALSGNFTFTTVTTAPNYNYSSGLTQKIISPQTGRLFAVNNAAQICNSRPPGCSPNYTVLRMENSEGVTLPMFVSVTTGAVTSTGVAPDGYVLQ